MRPPDYASRSVDKAPTSKIAPRPGDSDAGDVRRSRAEEDVREAWGVLASDPEAVAAKLIELGLHAESELVRVRAARAVLDRVGLPEARSTAGGLVGAPTHASPATSAVDMLRERIATLRIEGTGSESPAALTLGE